MNTDRTADAQIVRNNTACSLVCILAWTVMLVYSIVSRGNQFVAWLCIAPFALWCVTCLYIWLEMTGGRFRFLPQSIIDWLNRSLISGFILIALTGFRLLVHHFLHV